MDRKSELRTALGPDYRSALRKLPGAVAALQHLIALGEARALAAGVRGITVGRYPLAADQIALQNYQHRLAQDEAVRNQGGAVARHWATAEIDPGYVQQLRDGIAGRLADDELAELVEHRIEHFRAIGNTAAERGSEEWRSLARAICISEYEALERTVERNEGDFSGVTNHPLLANAAPVDLRPPVSLTGLFNDYIKALEIVGKGREAQRRWKPVFDDLRRFAKHNDARRLTRQNLTEWRDDKLKTLSPKTVGDVYLSAVRTVLAWAVNEGRLDSNPAETVRQAIPKRQKGRERGFTLTEATAVLKAAKAYQPKETGNPKTSEAPQTTAAKRWAPLLCAFSGARITEITQLRKQDFRQEDGFYVMRITPDAGTVKAGDYRDVPLHQQIIDEGFLAFLSAASAGPLFYNGANKANAVEAARTVAGRISKWLQGLKIIPEGVQPSHGWRHRFKTVGRELGVSDRTLDAICGHASRTAGDSYGDVTVRARKLATDKFPPYRLD